MFISPLLFFIKFACGSVNEWLLVQYYFYWSILRISQFILELSSFFKWLIWITTFIGLRLSQPIFGGIFFIPMILFGYAMEFTKIQQRRSRRHYVRHNIWLDSVFDRRLMILSNVMIREDLVYLYCLIFKTSMTFYSAWMYTDWLIFSCLFKWLERHKPYSLLAGRLSTGFIYIFLIKLMLFSTVYYACRTSFEFMRNHISILLFQSKIVSTSSTSKLQSQNDLHFFDCNEYDDDHNIVTTNDVDYNIILPDLSKSLLTALQNQADDAVYVSFDDNTKICVVDNCANVHIWNEIKDFLPGSYIKFNEAASTAVSAVNGSSNVPAGCGDVSVSWNDDSGKEYSIILKNVLHFPHSPVKILSVVSLAEQLGDEYDTWILSRQKESIFTWAKGAFSKTIQHGKARLPEMSIRTVKDNVAAFHALVTKAATPDNYLRLHSALLTDRRHLSATENNSNNFALNTSVSCSDSSICSDDYDADEHLNDDDKDGGLSCIETPILEVGSAVRYIKDDHVEGGTLITIDIRISLNLLYFPYYSRMVESSRPRGSILRWLTLPIHFRFLPKPRI